MKPKITLEKFYAEFMRFVRGNDKRCESNEKRWESNEKRWESNEKRWQTNAKTLQRIEKKLDYSVDFLDKEILTDRKRITKLENITYKQWPAFY